MAPSKKARLLKVWFHGIKEEQSLRLVSEATPSIIVVVGEGGGDTGAVLTGCE